MKVLVIGFPKTGTKTLSAALRELGYSVYDFQENGFYLNKEWMKIFADGGTKEDFYRMFKDVDAASDGPTCAFWKEILEAFPNMKMIFMRRENEDIWCRSLMRQIDLIESKYSWKFVAAFSPSGRRFLHFYHHSNRIIFSFPSELSLHKVYGKPNATLAKLRYRQHNASVLLEAPKAQTLELNLSDGWEPVCKFLGKPIPDAPFPYENKGGDIVNEPLRKNPILARLLKEAVIGFSLSLAAVCAGGYFAYKNFPIRLFNPMKNM